MKVCVIQPWYSMDSGDLETCFQRMLGLMDECDPSMDLIVLPEYCDIPAATPNAAAFNASIEKYRPVIAEKVSALAKKNHAIVFANYGEKTDRGYSNATHVFDREGNEVGLYLKAHPAPSEVRTADEGGNGMDCAYSYSYAPPYTLELEGIRFAFLTCYDFYMYENFSSIARVRPDVIIGCSHQRTDTHDALEIIGRFLCYNTNAWLLRSSVTLGEDSPVCGCSMIVDPEGKMAVNMHNREGLAVCEIDPHRKYLKPAGFRGKPGSHPDYMNAGRRPWLLRPGGSMMVPSEDEMPFPRICAHRGFNTVAPENSMPAFGAAVALGAEEIEFDLWSTTDGELVSCHDRTLERVSDGIGNIDSYSLAELRKLNFGGEDAFSGLEIVRFEDILRKFAGTVIMNIHVKIWDMELGDPMYDRIAGLLYQYGAEKTAYFMTSSDKCLREVHERWPELHRCVGWDGNTEDMNSMVKRALALNCEKIQLFKPYFNEDTVKLAKANGILCNVFWADDPEEACRYLDWGIDTILTNDYLRVSRAVRKHLTEKEGNA